VNGGARRGWLLLASDFVAALVGLGLAYQLRYHFYPPYIPGGVAPDPTHYLLAAPVAAATLVLVFALVGVYRNRRGLEFIDELFSVTGGMAVTALVVFAMIALYREDKFTFSRLSFVYWAVLTTILIALARWSIRRYQSAQRARGVGVDRALVVGWGAAADLLVQRLRMFPDYGYRVVGVLADRMDRGEEIGGVEVLGAVDEIGGVVRTQQVDTVFVALSDLAPDRILRLIDCCRDCGIEFRILPGMLELMTTQVTADQIDGIPLLQLRHGLDIQGPKTAIKRAFDVAVALTALVLLSPLFALIALMVKLTSAGPVLIHQDRVGMRGRVFTTHKFRSMRAGAETETGPVWAAPDDDRRTAPGRLLRRLSLDELPQLWNILKGEMSLVGPRPERPKFVAEFRARLPRYDDRHLVRPGLAGWAQANDLRGQTPVEERLIYDLYYIENWSLAFDIKILLITLARVWTHKNAY
jgi:exopolysaccharide biosynthesis polyprenyl glycosylphosphotransferase